MITNIKDHSLVDLQEQAKELGLEVKTKDTKKILAKIINAKLELDAKREEDMTVSPADVAESIPSEEITEELIEGMVEKTPEKVLPRKASKGFHPITGKPVH